MPGLIELMRAPRSPQSCAEYIEVSEASPLAWVHEVTAQQLAGMTCIAVASDDQRQVESDYYRNVLNLECEFVFAANPQEARMMVAADRGFLRLESHEASTPAGTVIRRIPLVDGSVQLHRDYYAFYPAHDANPLAAEFAQVLKSLFPNAA